MGASLSAAEAYLPTDPRLLAACQGAAALADAEIVGQEQAVAALRLAVSLGPGRGHAFVVGKPGHGRHAITRQILAEQSRRCPTPDELLYLVRFSDPLRPQLLRLPPGVGQRFAAAMRDVTQALLHQAKAALAAEEEQQPGEVAALLEPLLAPVAAEFADYPEVTAFLAAVRRDFANGEALWLTLDAEGEKVSWTIDPEPLRRYEPHLIVARTPDSGAPLVECTSARYAQLFGWIESEARNGERVTHHQMIRAGALAQADGGFLLLEARALCEEFASSAALLVAIERQLAPIEPAPDRDLWGGVPLLIPDPIPIALQVVVIGTREEYRFLADHHPSFADIFSLVVPFAEVMERTLANEQRYAALLRRLAAARSLLPPQPETLARLLEEAARAAPDRTQLSLAVRTWLDLLTEADALARQRQAATIDVGALEAAIAARFERSGAEWRQVMRAIWQGELLIATRGYRIGQVNGLVVFEEGGGIYGHPVRITATVRLGGEGELIDIERESELGGAIHSKGVMILASFLAGRFARHRPLPLAASLVMEQSYAFVEGDSASLAEACALLSAIAQLPLAQGIAVTGSINQLGEVQPVGAINEKIEGWFAACAQRGLTGDQGVILPNANRHQLMVRAEVRAAVATGTFHLWCVESIDEAMALLTGRPLLGPLSSGAAVTQALARFARWDGDSLNAWRRPWQRRQEK